MPSNHDDRNRNRNEQIISEILSQAPSSVSVHINCSGHKYKYYGYIAEALQLYCKFFPANGIFLIASGLEREEPWWKSFVYDVPRQNPNISKVHMRPYDWKYAKPAA
jgi:hypothetical protein